MKKILAVVMGVGVLVFGAGQTSATLVTIGTASYDGSDYNLIWDDDNNGNSVVWFDYSRIVDSWQNQMDWAAGLNNSSVLVYNILPQYYVSWDGNWRLPSAGNNPDWGFDQIFSEMGHLFYIEMAFPGGSYHPYATISELNAGAFDNLITPQGYWLSTEYDDPIIQNYAWTFNMGNGNLHASYIEDDVYTALAIRPGQISLIEPVPEPATMLLLGTGLVGVAGAARRRKKK